MHQTPSMPFEPEHDVESQVCPPTKTADISRGKRKPCACGSTTHSRKTSKSCPLNISNVKSMQAPHREHLESKVIVEEPNVSSNSYWCVLHTILVCIAHLCWCALHTYVGVRCTLLLVCVAHLCWCALHTYVGVRCTLLLVCVAHLTWCALHTFQWNVHINFFKT